MDVVILVFIIYFLIPFHCYRNIIRHVIILTFRLGIGVLDTKGKSTKKEFFTVYSVGTKRIIF